MISKDDTRLVIEEVIQDVSNWRTVAISLSIEKSEIDLFKQVYNIC